MKIVFLIIMIVHGLIHTMGFVKAFDIADVKELTSSISRPFGIGWLIAAVLFMVSVLIFTMNKSWWGFIAIPAVILSQILIIYFWSDAKFGTIPNLIILVVAIVSIGLFLMQNRFQTIVNEDLENNNEFATDILTEKDIEHLPLAVQNYLHYTKSVGQPKIKNFRAKFTGGMRSNENEPYMLFDSIQYNFYQNPSRYFYMTASKMGLPATGLHIYENANATFEVKLLNWIPVVDAKGDKMTKGETVTVFNDMCFIAPATLIDKNIEWEEVEDLIVNATYTNGNTSISATLYFNEKGEMINFVSNDRYHTDGKTYESFPWETPISEYKELNGYILPAKAELIYQKPAGNFVYGELEFVDVKYNLLKFDW